MYDGGVYFAYGWKGGGTDLEQKMPVDPRFSFGALVFVDFFVGGPDDVSAVD